MVLGVGMNRMCSRPGSVPTTDRTSLLNRFGIPYANRLGATCESVPNGIRMAMLLVGLVGLHMQSRCRLTGRLLDLAAR